MFLSVDLPGHGNSEGPSLKSIEKNIRLGEIINGYT